MSKLNFEFPKLSVFDDNGNPLSGGKVYFYVSGTSTMKNTYADKDGLTTNANPVVLDTRGEANVFLDRDPYKIVVTDSGGTTVLTRDNYQGYLQEDDSYGADLLINADGRVNKNGYVSGTTLAVGDELFDGWYCTASGTVTFTAGGSITLSAGCKIKHINEDITAANGDEVTCFLESGSVDVGGLGLTATTVSVGVPVTFTINTGTTNYIELGAGTAQTFSGLQMTKGGVAVNCPQRPVNTERLIVKDYTIFLESALSALGVVRRAKFEYSSSNIVVTGGHYRMTSASYDKIVNISTAGISVAATTASEMYLYILSSGITTTSDITTSSQLSLSLTAPTLNHSRNGWYNNDDRCIGVFLLNNSTGYVANFICQGRLFTPNLTSLRSYYNWNTIVRTTKLTASMPIATGLESVIIEANAVAGSVAGENIKLYIDSDSGFTNTNGYQLQQNGTTGLQSFNSMTVELCQRPSKTIYMWAIGVGTAANKYVDVHMKGYKVHELI